LNPCTSRYGSLTGVVKDPEKNKPGEKGIHLTAKQKAAKEKAAAEAAEEVRQRTCISCTTQYC
jgi:hypothetical protein